jgi:hypothetical protein
VKRIILAAIALLLGVPATADALTIADGNFLDWSFDATGTATAGAEATGGDPGARINVTTVSGAVVYGTAIKNDFSTTEALEGVEFILSLDVASGPGAFAEGQLILLLVEQADTLYGRVLATTGYPRNFDTFQFTSAFDAAAFTRLLGTGASTPDFSGGIETRFGFAAGNELSNTLTQYYDNFAVQVPEPGGFAMRVVALGVVASLAHRSRLRPPT